MQWSKDELKVIFTYIKQHGPIVKEMAAALDMTKGQIDGIRRRNPEEWDDAVAFWDRHNPRVTPEIQTKAMQEALRLRGQKKELEGQLKSVIRDKTVLEELREMIKDGIPPLPNPDDYPAKATPSEAVSVETMVLNIGDIHGGEIVLPERVKFTNEYNSEICQKRFGHYIKSHLAIKDRLEASGGWYFNNLVVNLLGDMTSGTIHDIERHSDETIVRTCMGIARMVAEGILYLSRHYPEVYVTGVSGNHGKLPDQRRKAHKDPERNWDYLIYLAIAQQLRDIPNIECYFPRSYYLPITIKGWQFQITHGDDIKSWGNTPAYGLDRHARNQNAGEAMRGKHIDYFLMGHFHQQCELDVGGADLIVNGDFKGTDEWIQGALGKNGCPRQTFFAVHEEHGMTHKWNIKLANADPEPQYLFTISPWLEVEEDGEGNLITEYVVE